MSPGFSQPLTCPSDLLGLSHLASKQELAIPLFKRGLSLSASLFPSRLGQVPLQVILRDYQELNGARIDRGLRYG
jgi:hypothetical protein